VEGLAEETGLDVFFPCRFGVFCDDLLMGSQGMLQFLTVSVHGEQCTCQTGGGTNRCAEPKDLEGLFVLFMDFVVGLYV
jgi:hypothetical protein